MIIISKTPISNIAGAAVAISSRSAWSIRTGVHVCAYY